MGMLVDKMHYTCSSKKEKKKNKVVLWLFVAVQNN